MTIDWTKPVRTRSTKEPVRVLATDLPGAWPVIGVIGDQVHHWKIDGLPDSLSLLVENVPPEPVVRWVNVWMKNDGGIEREIVESHMSKEEANLDANRAYAAHRHLATVRIEFVPGVS